MYYVEWQPKSYNTKIGDSTHEQEAEQTTLDLQLALMSLGQFIAQQCQDCQLTSYWLRLISPCGAADCFRTVYLGFLQCRGPFWVVTGIGCCPASQVKKNQAHLLGREPLSWFCVSDLLLLKRRELATRCNPRWLENPNASLTQYEYGRMKPLLCPRHHRQVKQAVKT